MPHTLAYGIRILPGLAGVVGEELRLLDVGARKAYELRWERFLVRATDGQILLNECAVQFADFAAQRVAGACGC
jgi:hypothetical protein